VVNRRQKSDRPRTAEDARDSALRLLARRAHTRAELERKLAVRDFPAEAVTAALDRIEQAGYLRASDFAEAICIEARRRAKGRRWVEHKLYQAGVPAADVQAALNTMLDPGDERTRLKAYAQAHGLVQRIAAGLSAKEHAALVRSLQGRGFDMDAISALLADARDPQEY
jgi:regulatory protein